ncbi:hypothetical protein M3P36_04240 [Altererythrobacter sp. KTW20L]|uniref:hypothetical protein n=1 Tax=Altererythrobacter sp. KTW20L TaxID=2942210 RepID=UPI0020BEF4A1|nr:hypothetical protein [Altererythrobacter sp. KTW20L]
MTSSLDARLATVLAREVHPAIARFAAQLALDAGAVAVLFYGSNLRTGSLDGVIDYYVLLPGEPETGLWPRVSYREWENEGDMLRTKIATMTLAKFAEACRGETIDTTIWARFVQPSALVHAADAATGQAVVDALKQAARTAARVATLVGPARGTEESFWLALFRATYRAELRVEKPGREKAILMAEADHFSGLLPAALAADGIAVTRDGELLEPRLDDDRRRAIRRWWKRRRRMGKLLNVARLLYATQTFDGAGRYAAWKVERHTGVKVEVTPWREKHIFLCTPGVLWDIWRARRKA